MLASQKEKQKNEKNKIGRVRERGSLLSLLCFNLPTKTPRVPTDIIDPKSERGPKS